MDDPSISSHDNDDGDAMNSTEMMSPSTSRPTVVKNNNRNETELEGVKKENEFLKDYVMRLTKEMLHLQKNGHLDLDGNHNKTTDQTTGGKRVRGHISSMELPLWMLDSNVIPPIFDAYDMRIEELSTYIEQQGRF
jgi:hypothetical protein